MSIKAHSPTRVASSIESEGLDMRIVLASVIVLIAMGHLVLPPVQSQTAPSFSPCAFFPGLLWCPKW
jgi:hypothetical protein